MTLCRQRLVARVVSWLFLRSRVLLGKLGLEPEQEIVAETKNWLEARRESSPAYAHYLEHWGDWHSPD